jgi:hypothetical protein
VLCGERWGFTKKKKGTRSVAAIRRPVGALENGGDFAKILVNARCAATSSMARGVSCTAYRLNTRRSSRVCRLSTKRVL